MKQTLSNIITRFKKFAVFLLLIPVFTGVLSFVLAGGNNSTEMNKGVQFADVTISLGQFNDPQLNHPNSVKNLVSSSAFLNKVIDENALDVEVEDLKQNMTLENVYDELLVISLTGNDKETVKKSLQGIVDAFLSLSSGRYKEWTNIVDETVEDLQETNVSNEEEIEQKEFLYDLRQDLYNAREAEVMEPVTLLDEKSSNMTTQKQNPFKKTVFGVIIGLMLSAFLLLVPEVFRN
ncbi:hypothetical protein [Bacillus sp. KH172YL63]|uniref:hypothetical protein n=1 Tax=Bacillus sp. KH172YL63 TaxID=2709784 RepID=UPI0013E4A800|nr:hypothetical protein [Bacillus sp. KH172YL63]BCB05759.1 hypothetical protein KH172YL63_38920 [Bacillus sp. KH172YL63]